MVAEPRSQVSRFNNVGEENGREYTFQINFRVPALSGDELFDIAGD